MRTRPRTGPDNTGRIISPEHRAIREANGRGVIIVWTAFLVLPYIAPVRAADRPSQPIGTYSCADIRAAVALFTSVEAAVRAARAAGASDRQIEEALRCLATAR